MEATRWCVAGLCVAMLLACVGSSRADGIVAGVPPPAWVAHTHAMRVAPQARPTVDGAATHHGPGGIDESDGPAPRDATAQASVARVRALPEPKAGHAQDPRQSTARVAVSLTPPRAPLRNAAAPAIRGTGGNGRRRLRAPTRFVPVQLQARIDRVQPMTGIVLWNDNAGDLQALGADVQLEFAYLRYSDVVDDEGIYQWAAVDNRLAAAAARGHQMILRFHDTYPGRTAISIPAYIVNAPGYALTYHSVEGRQTFIPDWRSTLLQQFLPEFYTRLAQRYDQDPRLAFLQVGFGSYAEYHLWDGPLTLGRTFPSKAFQQRLLEHLGATFVQTPWSLSIDAASSTYSPFATVPALGQLRFGLFDDSFMHESHSQDDQEYNRRAWLFFGDQRHHHGPSGGEFSYYSEFDQRHVLDHPTGPYGRSFESFAAQYRISYMIGNDQPRYQTRARIRQAAMATGYAFRVTRLESDGTCVRMAIRNEGVAPIYHDAWPTANGRRMDASLKGLLPGDESTFQTCIGPHLREALEIGIESDRLVPGQRIGFNASLP